MKTKTENKLIKITLPSGVWNFAVKPSMPASEVRQTKLRLRRWLLEEFEGKKS